MAIRILALDGGGVRGALTARLLQHLSEDLPQLLPSVTIFAGTSTGSILAAGLAVGMAPSDLSLLYELRAEEIFTEVPPIPIVPLPGWTLWRAPYRQTHLERLLRELFEAAVRKLIAAVPAGPDRVAIDERATREEMRTAEGEPVFPSLGLLALLSRFIVIPALSLHEPRHETREVAYCRPVLMHNLPRINALLENELADSETAWNNDVSLVEAVLRSSAAPTYFPTRNGFLDGGVVANNPSLAAWTLAKASATNLPDKNDVRIFSASTGKSPNAMPTQTPIVAGKLGWARSLVDIFVGGAADLAEAHCTVLLGPRHHRLNAPLGAELANVRLDAARQVGFLLQRADELGGRRIVNGQRVAAHPDYNAAVRFLTHQFVPDGPFYTAAGAGGASPARARDVVVSDFYEVDGTATTIVMIRGVLGKAELAFGFHFDPSTPGVSSPNLTSAEILAASPSDLRLVDRTRLPHEYKGMIALDPARPSSVTLTS